MSEIRTARFLALALSFGLLGFAPSTVLADDEDDLVDDDPREKFAKLESELTDLFDAGKYEQAAGNCREQMKLAPENSNPPYNLACALARLGKKDEALVALAKSIELGFADAAHMKVDEDLASLRAEKTFTELVVKATENDKKAELGTYDPGVDVEGLKPLDRSPEGGLRYRLYVPEGATAEKPARLLVWLHPSGGSMNAVIEKSSPDWLKAGWAVLVPTQKRWNGWTEKDGKKLLEKSVPDAATVPGIDAKRPVLMGFSAGGHMALSLWVEDASRFGGLMIDAAYPIDMEARQRGEQKLLDAPSGDAAKQVPIYVLVGQADQGHMAWKMGVEDAWKAAGVPLIVHYVPEGKHEWLLRGELTADFAKWLADVAAGKLPGGKAPPAPPIAPAPSPEPPK